MPGHTSPTASRARMGVVFKKSLVCGLSVWSLRVWGLGFRGLGFKRLGFKGLGLKGPRV